MLPSWPDRVSIAGVTVLQKDIRTVHFLRGSPDLVVIGAPCQPFSHLHADRAGVRGSPALRHFVAELERSKGALPRAILLENVPGFLQKTPNSGESEEAPVAWLTRRLERLGYNWAYRVVDLRSWGVPQARQRLILLACLYGLPADVLLGSDGECGGSCVPVYGRRCFACSQETSDPSPLYVVDSNNYQRVAPSEACVPTITTQNAPRLCAIPTHSSGKDFCYLSPGDLTSLMTTKQIPFPIKGGDLFPQDRVASAIGNSCPPPIIQWAVLALGRAMGAVVPTGIISLPPGRRSTKGDTKLPAASRPTLRSWPNAAYSYGSDVVVPTDVDPYPVLRPFFTAGEALGGRAHGGKVPPALICNWAHQTVTKRNRDTVILPTDEGFKHKLLNQFHHSDCGCLDCRKFKVGRLDADSRRYGMTLSLLGDRAVGRKVEVFWDGDKRYYPGQIAAYHPATLRHTIHYDDGDVETCLLCDETMRPTSRRPPQ